MTIRLAIFVLVLAVATPAGAHIVYGTPSLHELTRDADLVVRARITTARRLLRAPDGHAQRPVVDAEVLETLHGDPVRRVTFAPHGHGPAEYHDGEEALLFLQQLDRVPELARTPPLAGRVAWVSLQETTDKIPLGPRTRRPWIEATRGYLRAQAIADPDRRRTALREATITCLASTEPRLAASALRALVSAGDALELTAADVARLDVLVGRGSVPVTVRVGVLAELERRGLVAGPSRWSHLLTTVHPSDLRVVVGAAGAHPSPEVTTTLLRIVDGPDAEAAADAAISLGAPGNDAAVIALTRLLGAGDQRLRFAAIRGLGRIGSASALEALQNAAAFHDDAATRRRAGAEVVVLTRPAASVATR